MAGMARVRLDPRALSRVRGGCRGARQHHAAVPCSFPRAGGGRKRLSRAADPPPPFSAGGGSQVRSRKMQQTTSSSAGREYPVVRCLVVHDPPPSSAGREYHPERCGQHARLLLREGPGPNNGKIGVFCTLRQKTSTFLARYSRNVPSDSVFSVRSVQNMPISPKWAVQECISVKSCQKAVLWLRWSTFGEDFAMFPRFAQELLIGASRV